MDRVNAVRSTASRLVLGVLVLALFLSLVKADTAHASGHTITVSVSAAPATVAEDAGTDAFTVTITATLTGGSSTNAGITVVLPVPEFENNPYIDGPTNRPDHHDFDSEVNFGAFGTAAQTRDLVFTVEDDDVPEPDRTITFTMGTISLLNPSQDTDVTIARGTNSVTVTITDDDTPEKPTGLEATHGDGSVTLTWNAVVGASSYQYTTDNGASWTTISHSAVSGDPTRLTGVATGLSNGIVYTFKLRAVNRIGPGPAGDDSVSALPRRGPTVPTPMTETTDEPTPERSPEATAEATPKATPRPTRTPAPTSTPVPLEIVPDADVTAVEPASTSQVARVIDPSTESEITSASGRVKLLFHRASRARTYQVVVDDTPDSCVDVVEGNIVLTCFNLAIHNAEGEAESDVRFIFAVDAEVGTDPEQVSSLGGLAPVYQASAMGGVRVVRFTDSADAPLSPIRADVQPDGQSGGLAIELSLRQSGTYAVIANEETLDMARHLVAGTTPSPTPQATVEPTPTAAPTPTETPVLSEVGDATPSTGLLAVVSVGALILLSAGVVVFAGLRRRD